MHLAHIRDAGVVHGTAARKECAVFGVKVGSSRVHRSPSALYAVVVCLKSGHLRLQLSDLLCLSLVLLCLSLNEWSTRNARDRCGRSGL